MFKLNPAPRAIATGFTLIEVLVVLAISGILLAIGVPMFNSTIARARASDAANTFLSAIEVTRSEAARRGVNVSACRVTNPAAPACSNVGAGTFLAGDWAAGWAVFAENNQPAGADGVIDAGDQVVIVQDRFPTGSALRAEIIDPGAGLITFRPDGTLIGGAINVAVNYPHAAAGIPVSSRTVGISVLGQVRVTNP